MCATLVGAGAARSAYPPGRGVTVPIARTLCGNAWIMATAVPAPTTACCPEATSPRPHAPGGIPAAHTRPPQRRTRRLVSLLWRRGQQPHGRRGVVRRSHVLDVAPQGLTRVPLGLENVGERDRAFRVRLERHPRDAVGAREQELIARDPRKRRCKPPPR